MSKMFDSIIPSLQDFIVKQKIFFVGTAAEEGRVNVSPKGMDSLRIINSNKLIWINLTGSGNETAAHILKLNRMTLMFCSFEENPLILRLYGTAHLYHERDEEFHDYLDLFDIRNGVRQVVEVDVKSVQTSCGYAVPLMEFQAERNRLTKWTADKGDEGLKKFQESHNIRSIDGYDTKIFEEFSND